MAALESDEYEVIDQLEASLSPEELAKIQRWLQPTDYTAQSSEFHRHLSAQAPGTGLWLCKTSKYQQWQASVEHRCIWIKGVPGAGKSVIAASMVEHLRKLDESTPVLNFFFRHIISSNRRPRNLIQDFLAQLVPYSARLQALLQALVDTKLELDEISDEVLWEHLLDGLASIEKVYLVIDALDEMELQPRDSFLARLNRLATFGGNNVKLIITSRPDQNLQKSLTNASIIHISLEDDLVGRDISLFVSYRLTKLLPQDGQEAVKDSLVSIISARSRGLFLYARLLLDQITPRLESLQQLDIEQLVKNIPMGLEEMYNNMLFRQARLLNIDTQIQVFLLELVTNSSRALRLTELASALSFSFPSSMIPGAPKSVTKLACSPLLEILEDETVQVIHHSFTEFLLNNERTNVDRCDQVPQFPVLNSRQAQKMLSNMCLGYLRSGGLRLESNAAPEQSKRGHPGRTFAADYGWTTAFTRRVEKVNRGYQEAKLRYPFLHYAVCNWAFHANKYDFEDQDFFESISAFLDPGSLDFRTWLELEWSKGQSSLDSQTPSPLHVAAFAGLTAYAKKLIDLDPSVDPRDGQNRTPLHWACARGHASMVSLLLKAGAMPDAEDNQGVNLFMKRRERTMRAL